MINPYPNALSSKPCTHPTPLITCIKGYLQLRDGAVQVVFEMLWKKLGELVESLERLVEL
jgi:hypothetical protein